MRRALLLAFASLSLAARPPAARAHNILALFPYPGRSHYIVFEAFATELARRGHNVTLYDPFPRWRRPALPNLRHVDLEPCFALPDILSLDEMARRGTDKWRFAGRTLFEFAPTADQLAGCEPLRRLWREAGGAARGAYDLVVTETFNTDFFLLFGHRLAAPVVAFHSSQPLPWMCDAVATPDNPACAPHPYSTYVAPMNWAQRLENAALRAYSLLAYNFASRSYYDRAAARLFGADQPAMAQLAANVSLLLLYSHASLDGARPVAPAVVHVAGLHIKPARPLPQRIGEFMDASTDGVVYFCMGSLLRGETLSPAKRDAFLYAFARIPQRVLWKWEGDEPPAASANVLFAAWTPQRDVLAHPNVKLFISHGGLLGTSEAVYEGVPILGIPIFGDQRMNVRSMQANGAGMLMEYDEISAPVVLEKIRRLLNDPRYRENAGRMSARYRDRPMSPMDAAVYWTEYVIRHRGAALLRTPAADVPRHQRLLLDVVAFLLLALAAAFALLSRACRFTLALVRRRRRRRCPRSASPPSETRPGHPDFDSPADHDGGPRPHAVRAPSSA